MAQLVERYVRNVQATSSNLVISTKKNLKRTTLSASRFRFFLLPLCFERVILSCYRAVGGVACGVSSAFLRLCETAVYAAKAA